MKKLFLIIKIFIFIYILSLIFVIGFARVDGNSMKPKLNNGDLIIYVKTKASIKRFDIIIFKKGDNFFIKRVIGLPGEKVAYLENVLYIDNVEINENFEKSITKDFTVNDISSNEVIPNDKILVLGDNRLYSTDSREFGLIDVSDIVGKVLIKIF